MSDDHIIIEPTEFSRAEASARKNFSLSPLKLALLSVFLLLTVAVLFMFSARAVLLSFNPGVDKLEFTSGYPTYLLAERHLMLPGTYEIQASREGYEPFTATLTVTDEDEQEYRYDLVKLPGILEIEAVDAKDPNLRITDAEVLIDQASLGRTPLIIDEVAAGLRDVYINHPRYLPYQTELEITGMRVRQQELVSLEPAWAEISVNSLPEGATIFLDDTETGKTPAVFEAIQGNRALRLKHSGYKSWETELEVIAGQAQILEDVVLIKSDGKLRVVSEPAGVNVTISGQYHGQTPLSVALAPAENYELLATKAGYESVTRQFAVEPEEDQSLNLVMKPVVGLIRLAVTPTGGKLFVDEQPFGDPNQTLELTARTHSLKVVLPGYATYETEIIPQPGLSQQLNVVMQTEEAARVSAIPQRITTSLGNVLKFIIPESLSMGAGRREPGRRSNEIQKEVQLTRSYYLGEKEISNASFKAFNPGHDSGLLGRALLSEDDRPVVNVSWQEAVEFCNWLSQKDGLLPAYVMRSGRWELVIPATTGYRLPTEAEWAWAARYAAGSKPTRFPWGENMPPTPGAGNFADVSAANMVPYNIQNYNDKFRGPAPSGTFQANELGIYDLAGNVSEWIHDYYSIELSRETLVDPVGPEAGDYYVIRGSNYTHGRFSELRWTFRDYGSDARPDVGFRIARYAE